MNYEGTIIEESLKDASVLQDVEVVSTKVEKVTKNHATPWIEQWTLHNVVISESQADDIAEKIKQALDTEHNWYADFKNNSNHYIIYKDRIFKINRSKQKEYQAATDHGISLGIPSYQVDFSPHMREWKR
jgi:hypothetical protein